MLAITAMLLLLPLLLAALQICCVVPQPVTAVSLLWLCCC
jgi:hypothetical protein